MSAYKQFYTLEKESVLYFQPYSSVFLSFLFIL
jgi:hypothetical protein